MSFSGFEALTVEAMRDLRAENREMRARMEVLESMMRELNSGQITVER